MRRAFHPVLPTWRQEEIPGFKNDQSTTGTSPAVQWFKLCASTAWGTGSIPGELRSSIPTHMVKEKKKGMTKARHSGLNKVQLEKVKPKLAGRGRGRGGGESI